LQKTLSARTEIPQKPAAATSATLALRKVRRRSGTEGERARTISQV